MTAFSLRKRVEKVIPKPPRESWWLGARREGFTDQAKQRIYLEPKSERTRDESRLDKWDGVER